MPTQQQKNSITAGMMIHGGALPGVCVGINTHQELERSMIQEGMFMHGDAFPARLTTKAPTEEAPSLDELTARLLALKKKLDDLKRQQAGGGV